MNAPDPAPEIWVLTFQAQPGDIPAEHRIRRLLKFAWRGLGLRCVRVGTQPDPANREVELMPRNVPNEECP
jgi:hypothetical protein